MEKYSLRWLKPTTIIVLSVVLAIGLGMMTYRQIVPTVVNSHAIYHIIESLEELEQDSEIIAVVSVAGKGRNVIRNSIEGDSKFYYTYTPIEIGKVYKGNVRPGDIIETVEPVGYQRLPSGLYFMGMEGYVPIQRNSSYLLFLRKSDSGAYTIRGLWQGKFVWPFPQNLTAEALEVTDFGGHYQVLYEAVAAKYGQLD